MNSNTKMKLKNGDQLEENVPYVFTIKDRNILDDKDDEIEVLENELINSSTNINNIKYNDKVNYYKENNNEHENKEEYHKNDIDLELNEEGSLIQNNHEEIREKLNSLKNNIKNNKNSFNLNQGKKIKSDFLSREEFKKRTKKTYTITLDPIPFVQNDNEFIVPDMIKKNYNDDDEDKYKLEKIKNKGKHNNEINLQQLDYLSKITSNDNDDNNNLNHPMINDNVNNNNTNEIEEIMTDNSLFLSNIPSKQQIEDDIAKIVKFTHQKVLSLKDIKKSGISSIINIPLPSEIIIYQKESEIKPVFQSNATQPIVNNNKLVESIAVDEIEEQLVGKGVCRALMVLKMRGILKEEESFGRNKDKSSTTNDYMIKLDDNARIKKPKNYKEIEIDYRDDKGRKLKPKEMARYQSHIFHGEKPGIKNTEKMLYKQETMDKISNSDVINNTKTMQYMKYYQNKKDKPFAVLEGKKYSSFL